MYYTYYRELCMYCMYAVITNEISARSPQETLEVGLRQIPSAEYTPIACSTQLGIRIQMCCI